MLSLKPKTAKKIIPVGCIDIFLTTTVPSKWLLMNVDRELDPSVYSELFSVIGYSFGMASNGHFKLPKLSAADDTGNFLYVCKRNETPCRLLTATSPKHQHAFSVSSDGNHSHVLPSDTYLRGDARGGKASASGGGSAYGNTGGVSHGYHYHSSSDSGNPTGIGEKSGKTWAPPAIEAFFAIYTGV